MKTLRFAYIVSTASLLLPACVAPAQSTAAATSAHPVPDLRTRLTPPHDARILYSGGQIQVIANDSSLNLTLLQIAAATGIRISGGAAEERIFGTYGPLAPDAVIRTLLQGTGTNMLLTQSSASGPGELVLTRQNGPVTPAQVQSATFGQPTPMASAAAVQPLARANITPTDPAAAPSESESKPVEPPPPPIPLTSGERALLIDRLQQQQRQAARKP